MEPEQTVISITIPSDEAQALDALAETTGYSVAWWTRRAFALCNVYSELLGRTPADLLVPEWGDVPDFDDDESAA